MTQAELIAFITRLMCCSSYMANEMATNLAIGGSYCHLNKLIILNGIIAQLQRYDVDSETNCLTEDEFETLITNSRNACMLCDCD